MACRLRILMLYEFVFPAFAVLWQFLSLCLWSDRVILGSFAPNKFILWAIPIPKVFVPFQPRRCFCVSYFCLKFQKTYRSRRLATVDEYIKWIYFCPIQGLNKKCTRMNKKRSNKCYGKVGGNTNFNTCLFDEGLK